MNKYLTVHSNGFTTYSDALIARLAHNRAQSFLFSLVGSPTQVQAASAHFFSGGLCRVSDADNADFELFDRDLKTLKQAPYSPFIPARQLLWSGAN